MRKFILIVALLFAASPAYAHHHVHPMVTALGKGLIHMLESAQPHPAGCPSTAFCGCGVSVRVFGHSVRDLWLAANWFRFPRTSAHAGAVAVRQHHVFYIEQAYGDGTVLAYDPNSGGHLTRLHRISLSGYTIVEPRGSLAFGARSVAGRELVQISSHLGTCRRRGSTTASCFLHRRSIW